MCGGVFSYMRTRTFCVFPFKQVFEYTQANNSCSPVRMHKPNIIRTIKPIFVRPHSGESHATMCTENGAKMRLDGAWLD